MNTLIMLGKVRRWKSDNQIRSCVLPASTSITAFWQWAVWALWPNGSGRGQGPTATQGDAKGRKRKVREKLQQINTYGHFSSKAIIFSSISNLSACTTTSQWCFVGPALQPCCRSMPQRQAVPPRVIREGAQYQENINSEPLSHSYKLIEIIAILTSGLLLKCLCEDMAVVLYGYSSQAEKKAPRSWEKT